MAAIAYLVAFALLTLTVAFGIGELRSAHGHPESVVAGHANKARVLTTTGIASFRRTETVQSQLLEAEPFARDDVYREYPRFDYRSAMTKTGRVP